MMAGAVQGEEEVIKNPYRKKTHNLDRICALMHSFMLRNNSFMLRNKHIRKIKIEIK